jgi:hypothetical protein
MEIRVEDLSVDDIYILLLRGDFSPDVADQFRGMSSWFESVISI